MFDLVAASGWTYHRRKAQAPVTFERDDRGQLTGFRSTAETFSTASASRVS